MQFRRQSVPRHPFQVAMLTLLRRTLIPKSHARIPAASSISRTAMLAAPICSFIVERGSALEWPVGPFLGASVLYGRA